MKAFILFVLFVVLGLCADLSQQAIPLLLERSRYSPGIQEFLTVAKMVPWPAVLFGLFFSIAVRFTRISHRHVGFEEITAFTLCCPLIIIFIRYVGIYLLRVLDSLHIPGGLTISGIHALMLGVIAHHGLYIYIGSVGWLILFIIGAGLTFAASSGFIPPALGQYWYTIMAGTLILLSFRERPVGA